jgi:hypothetical protein
MLAHIELRLELVVLQVVVLQLRLPPLHGQNIIGEIRVVNSAVVGQVLHQIPQALPDVLKLVEPGVVQVVSMQDLLNQFRLYSDLRDVVHVRHGAGLVHVRLEQRRHFVLQMEGVLIADGLIALRVGKLLHIPQVQPHREISPVRPLHLGKHLAHQFLPEGGQFLGLIGQILKLVDDLGQLLRVGELVDGALGVGYIV